jgi:2-polyprenyl-3-methyl-5-hydroxy-6-metoxy-1,4-benzoquinol methylase
LLFRSPTTTAAENQEFYQTKYTQGCATDMPGEIALQTLLATRFEGSLMDFRRVVDLLRSLGGGTGAKVFDFGCSWGYGSWQFTNAGFDVTAYEVSVPRAEYAAAKLGVRLSSPAVATPRSFDFFFSSHVIEHVPNPRQMFLDGLALLRPGGMFVALTPNGSMQRRRVHRDDWSKTWGLVHPQIICEEWIASTAEKYPYFISSMPVDHEALSRWKSEQIVAGPLVGGELFFAVRLPR